MLKTLRNRGFFIFIGMREPWLEYITKFGDMESIETTFAQLRRSLSDAGFKEEDLTSISKAPVEVFMLRDKLINKIQNSRNELKKYGMWSDEMEDNFDSYISRKLSKLEEKYPL